MANVIRHKRGTSNPAAGDFSNTAELLVNTSDGGVFTKTDGGSVVEVGSNASNLSTGTVPSGRLSGSYGISVTGSSASCTGNAASATVLQTARTIGGVSFNGSANINLPGVNTAGNQDTSGNAATTSQRAFSNDISTTGQGRFTGWYSGGASTGLATEIGVSSGQGYILAFNRSTSTYGTLNISGSGSSNLQFSGSTINATVGSLQQGGNQVLHAGNYTSYSPSLTGSGASGSWGISVTGSSASCTGNAASATVLQTARTINGTSFNGSANITITANTSNTLSRGSYLTGSNFNGSAATTWAVDATSLNSANKVVARDGSGDIAVRYLNSTYVNMSHSQSTRSSDTIFYSSTDNYVRKNTASGFRSALSVPHLAGNNTFTLAQRGQVDALSSASTITPNFNNSNNFSISLSTNTTIANPSNLTAGQSGAIAITYNGGYTVAFGSYWKFPGGTAPTATSTSGKTDVLVYYVESSTRISAQLLLNMGG